MDYKRLRKGKNQYERKSWKLELKLPYFTLYEYLSNTDSSDKVGVPLGQQIGPNLKHSRSYVPDLNGKYKKSNS